MNVVLGNKVKVIVRLLIKRISRKLSIKHKLKIIGKNLSATDENIETVFIINLDRQPDRWKKIKKEVRKQAIDGGESLLDYCHRVPAIDGKNLDINHSSVGEVQATYSLKDQYVIDPDPRLLAIIRERNLKILMTREEIAVALSHVNIWKRIVEEKNDYSLILEDDVFFEKDFAKKMNKLWLEFAGSTVGGYKFDVLYLSHRDVQWGAEKEPFSEGIDRALRGLWWLSGYILSFEGAKKLIEKLPVVGPVDLWINHHFRELNVFSTSQSIIFQREDIVSDNNYSILPVLSQVGIQADKTHLELENKKGKCPVFVIGLDDDLGDLATALSLLGYRCCYDEWGNFSDNISLLIRGEQPLLFDAYLAVKCISENYKKLDYFYKDAVFILLENHCSNTINISKKKEIIAHFKKRSDKLLVADPKTFTDWSQICKFLCCDTPSYSFPRNSSSTISMTIVPSCYKEIAVKPIKTEFIEHDVHPWIVPLEKADSYGVSIDAREYGLKQGSFVNVLNESFNAIDNSLWNFLEDSFPSNLAMFRTENVSLSQGHGLKLSLVKEKAGSKGYSSAAISSKEFYRYGRFESNTKPANGDGVITAFFLHRNDPWQEIDIEFLGKDTTKLLINVYYNPGVEGTLCNYGNRGTPVIIDLGFDASKKFHNYAIEWEPHEIRWYVDDILIHKRSIWSPTPIPNLPMQLFSNIWVSRSEELAGKIADENLPVNCYIKTINIGIWKHSIMEELNDGVLSYNNQIQPTQKSARLI